MTCPKPALFAIFASSLLFSSGYSDVLVVSNAQSPISIQVANYFSQQRNITRQLAVSMPLSDKISFYELNQSLIAPLKSYLNGSKGEINYIVLSKGIPLYTDGKDVFSSGNSIEGADASSVDSEIALIDSPFEQYMGKAGAAPNPYYGQSEPFSKKKFGIYLVSRLDGYGFEDIKGMIDRSASISKEELASGQHVFLGFQGIYARQLEAASQQIGKAGLRAELLQAPYADEVRSGIAHAKSSPGKISIYDTFGCYNLGGCNASYFGIPNLSWANGSLVSIKYSFSSKTASPPSQSSSWMPRSLIADYIHQGATGGLGYAVEPMSSQVSNPEYLAKSYLSGRNLAEILWSSVPSLSWSAVVYGDPKAQYPKFSQSTLNSSAKQAKPALRACKSLSKSQPNEAGLIAAQNYAFPSGAKTEDEGDILIPSQQGLLVALAASLAIHLVSRFY
ncbi:MAG: TIGR03790 family protein [Candidatus Micrarchaeota archaeon]|nr:TIGR03790 family protein [Candidatus Micrarchaeota archaeon]